MSVYAQLIDVGDWRRKELSQFKAILPHKNSSTFECLCRGMLVLCYSHWEGYFSDLTEKIFLQFDAEELSKVVLTSGFRSLFLRSEIDRLASSRVNDDNIVNFLVAHDLSQFGASSMDLKPINPRSSLNSERLNIVAQVYGLSWVKFERKRIFVDHKLCQIRHQIAHGEAPTLTRELALEIVDETLELLDDLADYFDEIYIRIKGELEN